MCGVGGLEPSLRGWGVDGQGEVVKASEAEDEGEDVEGDRSHLPRAEQVYGGTLGEPWNLGPDLGIWNSSFRHQEIFQGF